MNLLYLSPSNTVGGAEVSLFSTAKFMKDQGHKLFLALPPSPDKKYEESLKPFVEEFLYVKSMAWHIPRQKLGFWKSIVQYLYSAYKSKGWHVTPIIKLWRFIRKHKIDLVHTNTIMSIDGAFAAKLARVPHIQHIREAIGINKHSLAQFPLMTRPVLFKKLMNNLHTRILTNSEFTKEICKTYFPEEKLVRIYNPLGVQFFSSKKNIKKKLLREPLVIGLVANVTSRLKNHALFVEIANVFNEWNPDQNVRFNLYGKLPPKTDPYFLNLKKKVTANRLENVVEFKGQYANATEIYSELDILIHTYPHEAFGRIFIEAMAMGVPVIAAEGGGASELIEDGETGFLVDVNAPGVFAEKIEAVLNDPDLGQSIVEKGRIFAERFKTETIGRALEKVYYEVLQN